VAGPLVVIRFGDARAGKSELTFVSGGW
jgi:hypothetical protein